MAERSSSRFAGCQPRKGTERQADRGSHASRCFFGLGNACRPAALRSPADGAKIGLRGGNEFDRTTVCGARTGSQGVFRRNQREKTKIPPSRRDSVSRSGAQCLSWLFRRERRGIVV